AMKRRAAKLFWWTLRKSPPGKRASCWTQRARQVCNSTQRRIHRQARARISSRSGRIIWPPYVPSVTSVQSCCVPTHAPRSPGLITRAAVRSMYDNTHRHGLTEQDQANLLHAIGIFVRTAIADALAPLERRLILLEAKGIAYHGSYQRSADYKRG